MDHILLRLRRAIISLPKDDTRKLLQDSAKEIRQLNNKISELNKITQYVDKREIQQRKNTEAVFGRWR